MQISSHPVHARPFQPLGGPEFGANPKARIHTTPDSIDSRQAQTSASGQTGLKRDAGDFGNDRSTQKSTEAPRVEAQQKAAEVQALEDLEKIRRLAARDREVRAHEQAHMAAGGQYAGGATYAFERGPNGVAYAVAGEVPISTGDEATAAATLQKARVIRRAALAPAEPSPADRQVAAEAAAMEARALREISRENAAIATDEGNKTESFGAGSQDADKSSRADRSKDSVEKGNEPSVIKRSGFISESANPYQNSHTPGAIFSRFA